MVSLSVCGMLRRNMSLSQLWLFVYTRLYDIYRKYISGADTGSQGGQTAKKKGGTLTKQGLQEKT